MTQCSEQQKKIRKDCNPKKEKEAGIHGLFGARGNEDKDKGNNDRCKNKSLYNFLKRMKVFSTNVKLNKRFWFTFIIGVFILSFKYGTQKTLKSNIIMGFFSVFLAMFVGYFIHMLSHHISFVELYNDSLNQSKYIPKSVHKINKSFLKYTFDFHDLIHHDSSINKSHTNILIEGIQNLIFEGGLIILFYLYFKIKLVLNNETYSINPYVVLFWMILYTSVHLINYRLVHPNSHIAHHMDYYKNLSLTDLFDLIFGSKYDENEIQDLDHFTINAVFSVLGIIIVKELFDLFG